MRVRNGAYTLAGQVAEYFGLKEGGCKVCGTQHKTNEIHHVDGNILNNLPENLAYLCKKHHARVHKGIDHDENSVVREPCLQLIESYQKRIQGAFYPNGRKVRSWMKYNVPRFFSLISKELLMSLAGREFSYLLAATNQGSKMK